MFSNMDQVPWTLEYTFSIVMSPGLTVIFMIFSQSMQKSKSNYQGVLRKLPCYSCTSCVLKLLSFFFVGGGVLSKNLWVCLYYSQVHFDWLLFKVRIALKMTRAVFKKLCLEQIVIKVLLTRPRHSIWLFFCCHP